MNNTLAMETGVLVVRLKGLLRRVPASVCNGSQQVVVAYKKHVLEGSKLAAQKNPKYPALKQAVNQLEAYGV